MRKLLDVVTGKSSLWPQGRSDVMPTGNNLLSQTTFGLPFVNYSVFKDTPYWQHLNGLRAYMEAFARNPVFFAVVMIKAREYANMRFVVKSRRTGKIEPETTQKIIPSRIYKLLNRPNIQQKRWEFLMQRKIFREVCGNTFTYGNSGFGVAPNINSIVALWNVWPQYMQYKLGGKYFDATESKDIVSQWRFEYGEYKKEFSPEEILHQNSPNLDPQAGLILGTPTAYALSRPLTNIEKAYEATNVIMDNRGARLFISSNKGDTSGKVPLLPQEKKEFQDDIKKKGFMENQEQFWFSNLPLNITAIEQDIRKLGIREEVAVDTMAVAHAFGVPEILVKLYLQGATFENQEASRRRLYQGTLIPESEDDIISFNEFLQLTDTEWCVEGSFDHVDCLQKSRNDAATANSTTSNYMEKLFLKGGCTLNQWRKEIEMEPIENPIADKYIFEMTPEEVAMVTGRPNTQPSTEDESSQGDNQEDTNEDKQQQKRNQIVLDDIWQNVNRLLYENGQH